MALLFMDGFEAGDHLAKWRSTGAHVSTAGGRFGLGRYLTMGSNGNISYDLATPVSKVFVGAALGGSLMDAAIRPYIGIYSDNHTVLHLCIGISGGSLQVRRTDPGNTILGTYSAPFYTNTLYYVEVAATIADSGGTCVVRLNGVEVINYTGDTRNGGTSTLIDSVSVTANGGFSVLVDDFYLCDDTGLAPHNTFLGDIRIQALVPNAAGSSTQFTPSSGANYTTVDELPMNAADFVSSSTVGHKDMYAFSNLGAVNTVYGIQNNVIVKKTDASALSLKPVITSGSTTVNGATVVLSATDVNVRDIRALNPDTSAAWDQASVNALEAGFEVA